jgi:hypothetical protein
MVIKNEKKLFKIFLSSYLSFTNKRVKCPSVFENKQEFDTLTFKIIVLRFE